jgi:hypothetical protein
MSPADDAGFLARWSRRKAAVKGGAAAPVDKTIADLSAPAIAPSLRPAGSPDLPPAPAADQAPEPLPLPTLDDVAGLTRDSDYTGFMRTGVDPGVRNAAMKKLFADPHFNVMDGLDTYIDDYGRPDPIPLSMLRQLHQSKALGLFDEEPEQERLQPSPDAAAVEAVPIESQTCARVDADPQPTPGVASSNHADPPLAPPDARHARADDDPDLRLQQDDGARQRGVAPGSRA